MAGLAMGIIDGTGAFRDDTYAQEMRHSFCKQLADGLGARAYYQQGPWIEGMNDAFKMYRTADWLVEQHRRDPSTRIMLAGYSRGAATVSACVHYLAASSVKVDSLFLFDAVARHILAYGRTVSANTAYCAHAIRNQTQAYQDTHETFLLRSSTFGTWRNPFASNVTRPSFGGVAGTAEPGVQFESQVFTGSHGALGGVGWKSVPEDPDCQAQVAGWMNARLRARGVDVSLVSFPPEG